MSDKTTWRRLLLRAMEKAGDPGPVIAHAPDESAFKVKFNNGYGGAEGPPVLAWTATRVYFPIEYDGSEFLGSAPRNPAPEGQRHQ